MPTKCKCIRSRKLQKGKNKGQLKCEERKPKGCRLPKNWADTSIKSPKKPKKIPKKSKKLLKQIPKSPKKCECIKSRKLQKGKNKGQLKCEERKPKGCRLPKNWADTSIKAKPIQKSPKKPKKSKKLLKQIPKSPKKPVAPLIIPDYYYEKNMSNIKELRKRAKDDFSAYLTGGSYSVIFTNPSNPNWILRRSEVNKDYVDDEIKITKGMLNRPGQKPNLTDIWVEKINANDVYIFSISRRFTGDGRLFTHNSKYMKNPRLVSKFYTGLYKEFQYLHNLGWACYDLKPTNLLIDEAKISPKRDDWVRLTDFGADWCKNQNQLDDVIDPEYQPLFMLILFQVHSTLYITYKNEFEKGFYKFINNLSKFIKSSGDYNKFLKNLQKIYDFLLYLLIVPVDLLDPKYKTIQRQFLWYTCKSLSVNFSIDTGICTTLVIITVYFKNINKSLNNKLDLRDDVVDIYENTISRLEEIGLLDMPYYTESIESELPEIRKDLDLFK